MKLSSRETVLAAAVGAAVFLFLNLILVSALSKRNTALRAELAQQRLEWAGMQELLGQRDLWANRDAALTAKQPNLTNENAAGVELYDMIRGLAQKHSVTTQNPDLNGGVVKTEWYRSVPVAVQTSSSWPQLISFLYALQRPDQYIVCEKANIQVDATDPTKIDGSFTISRWYAP